jgi:hypothetical protein
MPARKVSRSVDVSPRSPALQDEVPAAIKSWIDSASYEALLERWRNAPVGDPAFQGAAGAYYRDAMAKKKAEVGQDAHVRASKSIGWGGGIS